MTGGVYSLAPQEGITQMSLANICTQFSSNISQIRFIKSNSGLDSMYENIYTSAPYLPDCPETTKIESDIYSLVTASKKVLRKEKDENKFETQKLKDQNLISVSKIIKSSVIIAVIVIFLLAIILPVCFSFVNSKLLSDSNRVFIKNYNQSTLTEVSEDARYNKDKAQGLYDNITFAQWILPIIGDDYSSNKNYLMAQKNYFEALSYVKDYRFLTINDSSRGLVKLKIEEAKTLIDSVNKDKLFGDLNSTYDDMKSIIDNTVVP
jgi:hypothetical protein